MYMCICVYIYVYMYMHICIYTHIYVVCLVAQTIKTPPAILETSSVPGFGRFPDKQNGHSLQYSCLENSLDRGAWWATAQGVTKGWT